MPNIKIKKAIIPVAGLATRFLPLSRVVPKELWPLVDKPVLQYIVEEIADAGIEKIIFVSNPRKKIILDYFNEKIKSEKVLRSKHKKHFLKELENLAKLRKKVSFSQVIQKQPLGCGHAILQAKNLVDKEPCAVLWSDDVVEAKTPCILQLIKVFKKYQKPIIALAKVPKKSFPFYGMVKAEKITNRVYKIKDILEKPSIKQSPSNLAVVGKYILTPEVFNQLEKFGAKSKGEIILTKLLAEMAKNGQEIYGYEFEGKWLECGNKSAYLKSNFYLSLKNPQFNSELKNLLKN